MSPLKLSLVQCNQFWEDKEKNLSHFDELLNQIKETDLIILPEMFHTAFSMNTKNLAEKTDNSLALSWLKMKAIEKNSAIYTSFIAEENSKFYNRGVFVYPNGNLIFYDKRKLFTLAKEDEFYTSGNEKVIIDYKKWKINLQICFDLRFPEVSRNKITNKNVIDYDLCLYVANWPEKRVEHWKTLLRARSIENQCFLVGLNRVGTDGKGLVYSGDSAIYSPYGEKLTKDYSHQEKIIECEISKTSLEEIRRDLNFLEHV
jgi:omega-amidase